MPTRKATQFRHNLRTLCRLQASYWELVQRSLHAPGRPERSGEILACFHLVYHEAAQYAAALPAGEAERYRTCCSPCGTCSPMWRRWSAWY